MSEQDSARLARELRRKAARARYQSRALQAQSAAVAHQVASTGNVVADRLLPWRPSIPIRPAG